MTKIETVEQIVRSAGEHILNSSRSIVSEKGSKSNYATACDLKIEHDLAEKLPQIFPGSTLFSEEGHSVWNPNGLQWIVDPLDGTANFRHNFGASAVSVALMAAGKIVLGIVYDAESNRFFSAIFNKGAFLNGKAIKVSTEPMERSLAFVQLGVYYKENSHAHASAILRIFNKCEDVRSIGSAALELSMIGAGKAELFYAPRLFPWDFAAASLIIQEAGGRIGPLDQASLFSGNPCAVWAANSSLNGEKLLNLLRKEESFTSAEKAYMNRKFRPLS